MKRVRIRPRYTLSVPISKNNVIEKIRNALEAPEAGCKGKFVKPMIVLSVLDKDQNFWSPELSMDLEEVEGETFVNCVLGPRASLWTLFATFYGFAVLLGLGGLLLGICQLFIDTKAYGFWFVPVSLVLLALAYAIALTGQKLAYDQMIHLGSFLERALGIDSKFKSD